jgi:hypothetical protein
MVARICGHFEIRPAKQESIFKRCIMETKFKKTAAFILV